MAERLTDREKMIREVSEAQWLSKVEHLLAMHGWLWYHPVDNIPRNGYIQNIKPGFPDLVAIRGRRIMYIELKKQTGRVSPDQEIWHQALREAGQEVYVWRPSDIEEVIETIKENWASV